MPFVPEMQYEALEARLGDANDRIERLEETIAVLKVAGSSHCVAAIRAYRARIERLEAALRPFAHIAVNHPQNGLIAPFVRVYDIDRARRALGEE